MKRKLIIEFDDKVIDPMIAENSIKDLTQDWDWVKNVRAEGRYWK